MAEDNSVTNSASPDDSSKRSGATWISRLSMQAVYLSVAALRAAFWPNYELPHAACLEYANAFRQVGIHDEVVAECARVCGTGDGAGRAAAGVVDSRHRRWTRHCQA
jgi:hypothetical protein